MKRYRFHSEARAEFRAAADWYRARSEMTEALGEFPLHPYLLLWRGRLRLSLMTEKAEILAPEDAQTDLESAVAVAPNYLSAHYELAQAIYVHSDDDEGAAARFGEVVERSTNLLCAAAAGRIKALADTEKLKEAKAELQRWLAVFPEDAELQDAQRWVALTDRPGQ